MEKAIDRQRVLLAHLLPSASPSAFSSTQPQLEVSVPICCMVRLSLPHGLGWLIRFPCCVCVCVTVQASACAAGDSAAYQRTSSFGDDVVVVA